MEPNNKKLQHKTKFNPIITGVVLMLVALASVSAENLTAKWPVLNWIGGALGLIGFVMLMAPLIKVWIAKFKNKK